MLPTDGRTDRAGYRVACTRLKIGDLVSKLYVALLCIISPRLSHNTLISRLVILVTSKTNITVTLINTNKMSTLMMVLSTFLMVFYLHMKVSEAKNRAGLELALDSITVTSRNNDANNAQPFPGKCFIGCG